MPMFIPKGVNTPIQMRTHASSNISVAPKPTPSVRSAMIQRIHTSKPGCGSCGRH